MIAGYSDVFALQVLGLGPDMLSRGVVVFPRARLRLSLGRVERELEPRAVIVGPVVASRARLRFSLICRVEGELERRAVVVVVALSLWARPRLGLSRAEGTHHRIVGVGDTGSDAPVADGRGLARHRPRGLRQGARRSGRSGVVAFAFPRGVRENSKWGWCTILSFSQRGVVSLSLSLSLSLSPHRLRVLGRHAHSPLRYVQQAPVHVLEFVDLILEALLVG